MGNTAYITFSKKPDLGIYLHWNGGYDSVTAFLEYCRLKRFRTDDYGLARLTQVIANFIGGGLSIGIQPIQVFADTADNGIYFVNDDWTLKSHYIDGKLIRESEETHEYPSDELNDMLKSIDETQPERERLGDEFFSAPYVDRSELHTGDTIYEFDPLESRYVKCRIAGKKEKKEETIPYTNRYDADNPNSELREEKYKRLCKNK